MFVWSKIHQNLLFSFAGANHLQWRSQELATVGAKGRSFWFRVPISRAENIESK